MGISWIPAAIGAADSIAGIVQGNQTKQRNKGAISQAYRTNVAQTNLQQANTREDSNESLNARGVLSPGAARPNIGSITQAVASSGGSSTDPNAPNLAQNAVNQFQSLGPGAPLSILQAYGQKAAAAQPAATAAYNAKGGALSPYLAQAGTGAIGAANTLAGGQNAQMTDQFALQDKSNQDAETQALNANQATYDNTILNSVAQGVGAANNIAQGQGASTAAAAIQMGTGGANGVAGGQPGSITSDNAPATGAYGMNQNPQFFGGSGTRIGTSNPNYSFNAGTG